MDHHEPRTLSGVNQMIILGLVILFTALYFIGGQKWAHTLIRDVGCSLCTIVMLTLLFGWSWLYPIAFGLSWGGMAFGDHENWYWSLHGFVIGLAMCVVSFWLGLLLAVISAGVTYFVSRFSWKGSDVILRGLLYATLPLTLKLMLSIKA